MNGFDVIPTDGDASAMPGWFWVPLAVVLVGACAWHMYRQWQDIKRMEREAEED